MPRPDIEFGASERCAEHEGNLCQRLAVILGLNLARGLECGMGQPSKLARYLTIFVESHAQDADRLRPHLAGGDLKQAHEIVHSLKGVAGTLGAVPVYAASIALETAILHGASRESLGQNLHALATELSTLVDGIRNSWGLDCVV